MSTHDIVMKENSDLFHMLPSGPIHMSGIGIKDISFTSLDSARVTFIARVPSAIRYLSEIPNGATLEIVNRHFGLRSEYAAGDAIARLSHCIFEKRQFPNLVAICPEDAGRIALYAEAVCKLDLLLD